MGRLKEVPVRVLCVDDEPPILEAMKFLAEGEEFELLTATSAERGLDIVRSHDNVGVVIADQQMPVMSGVEFLEKVWEIAPDTVRIMLTGHGDESVASEAINRGGAFRYTTKPWRNRELLQQLRDAVQIYRLVCENRRLTSIIGRLGGFAGSPGGETPVTP